MVRPTVARARVHLLALALVTAACSGSSAGGSSASDVPDAPETSGDTGPDVPPCTPACDDKTCGPDGCGGSCGDCAAPAVCLAGQCCTPDCTDRVCGPDGCGGACGDCAAPTVCLAGQCCTPQCAGKNCGPDGCGGHCGTCAEWSPCLDGVCCTPDCLGKDCGPDGCMGSCGTCTEPAVCIDSLCCAPACAGLECGSDGCGGNCGHCTAPRYCQAGRCALPDADEDGVPDVADPFPDDAERPGEALPGVVYAHSGNTLYLMDVKTYRMDRVADFAGLEGDNESERRMTDLAIDAYGVLWGVSYLRLYTCHPATGQCNLMVDLNGLFPGRNIYEFNALTMVPAAFFGELRDVMIGVSNDGGWFRFDVDYDAHEVEVTRLGTYGYGRRSSGDAYSIEGVGTFAAVDDGRSGDDYIVEVDPRTGQTRPDPVAVLEGRTSVFGLAGWTEHAFAFDRTGEILVVDTIHGRVVTRLVHRVAGNAVALCELGGSPVGAGNPTCDNGSPIEWWGAGVRTLVVE